MTEHETRPLDGMAFATRAVHAGERPPHPDYTPVVTPIYPGSSFAYDDMAVVDEIFAATREGYAYTRYGNPTNSAIAIRFFFFCPVLHSIVLLITEFVRQSRDERRRPAKAAQSSPPARSRTAPTPTRYAIPTPQPGNDADLTDTFSL